MPVNLGIPSSNTLQDHVLAPSAAMRLAYGFQPGGLRAGFAAFSATALDPPHRAASPAVPALNGSGSPRTALAVRNQAAVACRSTIRMNSRAISL
jgi:hypothetical protein